METRSQIERLTAVRDMEEWDGNLTQQSTRELQAWFLCRVAVHALRGAAKLAKLPFEHFLPLTRACYKAVYVGEHPDQKALGHCLDRCRGLLPPGPGLLKVVYKAALSLCQVFSDDEGPPTPLDLSGLNASMEDAAGWEKREGFESLRPIADALLQTPRAAQLMYRGTWPFEGEWPAMDLVAKDREAWLETCFWAAAVRYRLIWESVHNNRGAVVLQRGEVMGTSVRLCQDPDSPPLHAGFYALACVEEDALAFEWCGNEDYAPLRLTDRSKMGSVDIRSARVYIMQDVLSQRTIEAIETQGKRGIPVLFHVSNTVARTHQGWKRPIEPETEGEEENGRDC